MIYLHTFLYYACFASSILLYGIGLNTTVESRFNKAKDFIYLIKLILNIFVSSILTWIVAKYILEPIHLIELFPLFAFLIQISISVFVEGLIRLTAGRSTSEFIFSYLIIILSVLESTSLLNTIVISGSCLFAVMILLPLIYAFRMKLVSEADEKDKYFSRLFLFLAIIILVISSWDIMWMNAGVIK